MMSLPCQRCPPDILPLTLMQLSYMSSAVLSPLLSIVFLRQVAAISVSKLYSVVFIAVYTRVEVAFPKDLCSVEE